MLCRRSSRRGTPTEHRPAPDAAREEHFQAWLAKYGQPYTDAVIKAGGTPWTTDVEQRRELFFRRYKRLTPTKTQERSA